MRNGINEDRDYMLNIDFVDFVVGLKEDKIEIVEGMREKIVDRYKSKVGLKMSNVYKVGGRVLREEVRSKLIGYLKSDCRGMDIKVFVESVEKIIRIGGRKRSIKRRYV